MDAIEKKILRALKRHGVLSQTALYRFFHRYRAAKKNTAINNLVKLGLVDKQIKWLSASRKPTQLFALNAAGAKFLTEDILTERETKAQ